MLDPVAVALKFGFLAVLYLFLLWVARSALRDLRRDRAAPARSCADDDGDRAAPRRRAASAPTATARRAARRDRAPGCAPGRPTTSPSGALLGRGDEADIVLEDSVRLHPPRAAEPAGRTWWCSRTSARRTGPTSTASRSAGPQPLHAGDRIRIGDSEFTFER